MAKLITRKYKNNNSENNGYGKTYARFIYTETVSIGEFANHIATHGSPYTRDIIQGVLMKACDCLVEIVKDSKKVQLGDLGTFYLSPKTEGADNPDDFTAENVKQVFLRFMPNRTQAYPLDSISMRKVTSFRDIDDLLHNKNTESGTNGNSGNTVVENP